MTLAATVLIPTHDHGPTLLRSVPSILAQTVSDLEVFVIGDGVPDVTREVMSELARDERVTFYDHPKGPRHGEIYRHEALRQARGEIVCYLADDDLWLPGHIAQLRDLLADADFAHTRPLWIDTEGQPHPWLVDLAEPVYPKLLHAGSNRIPLGCAGHTLSLYRRLPAGWRTTPPGTPTDLYMWQQILSVPGCRALSGTETTLLHFPSPDRQGWSTDDRVGELDAWTRRLSDPGLPSELSHGLLQEAVALEVSTFALREQLGEVDADRAQLSRRLDALAEEHRLLQQELAERPPPRPRRRLRSAAKALAARAAPAATRWRRPARTRAPSPPATESRGQDRPTDS